MLDLIVLGIIPGTSKQLTLNWIAAALSGLLAILALRQARRHVIVTRALRRDTDSDTETSIELPADITATALPAQA